MITRIVRFLAGIINRSHGAQGKATISQEPSVVLQARAEPISTEARSVSHTGESSVGNRIVQSLPESEPRSHKARLINVGLDFGTAATKVFIRDIYTRKSYGCTFADALDALGPFCWPSTVCIDRGRLYFGTRAELAGSRATVRSFKICIACQEGFFRPEQCPTQQCLHFGGTLRQFRVTTVGERDIVFAPSHLAILYLANLMGSIEAGFLEPEPLWKTRRCTYNMVAPLDMVDVEKIKRAFQSVLHLAYLMRNRIEQGIPCEEAENILNAESANDPPLPEDEVRQTFLIPETHAAMVGYMNSGKAEPGLFAAIDVGAGTTDVAIFRYCSELAERDLAYYAAKTGLVGGDAIDKAICDLALPRIELQEGCNDGLLARVRIGKHTYSESEGLSFGTVNLNPQEVAEAIKPVLDRIFQHYSRTWGSGYEKEMRQSHWREMNILLLGGCNQLPFVRSRLSENPRDYIIRTIKIHPVRLPEKIGILGELRDHCNIHDFASLLTVAHGLSFHIGEDPDYFAPHEVAPLASAAEEPTHDLPDNWWSGG